MLDVFHVWNMVFYLLPCAQESISNKYQIFVGLGSIHKLHSHEGEGGKKFPNFDYVPLYESVYVGGRGGQKIPNLWLRSLWMAPNQKVYLLKIQKFFS